MKYQTWQYSFVLFPTSWIGYTVYFVTSKRIRVMTILRVHSAREKCQTLRHTGRYAEKRPRYRCNRISIYNTRIIIDDYESRLSQQSLVGSAMNIVLMHPVTIQYIIYFSFRSQWSGRIRMYKYYNSSLSG